MKEKLYSVIERHEEIEKKLNEPEIASDINKLKEISREYKKLTSLVETAKKYLKIDKDLSSNKELIASSDAEDDLKELAEEENEELIEEKEKLEEKLKLMMIPKDPNDSKNCIFEIRAGAGGDEAGIFAGDLFRMYQRYCERNDFDIEIIAFNESDRGGFKEIVFSINGEDAYGTFKFESGVHRVQRVPETEASGRLHTSAATVAVLPEAEVVDVEINESDLRIDVFRSSGKGGQSVNKLETAVRIVHNPTGIVVNCQEERSQLKNKAKAMKVLRSRLFEMEQQKRQQEISSSRRSMVKSGDRSEKIRTYNFPQNRVTDHRLEGEEKNYNLDDIIEGDLDDIIENLQIVERSRLLKETNPAE